MALEFVQQGNLLSHKGIQCLRNDYAHNACSLCIDICPEDVFSIQRGRFTISGDGCTSCAACLGGCPTEALHLQNFDPNSFTLLFKSSENEKISCKSNTSCLAAFDAKHFVTMALSSEKTPLCDLSHCATCEMNHDHEISSEIEYRIKRANEFMHTLGLEQGVAVNYEPEEKKRFAAFKQAIKNVSDTRQEGATELFKSDNSRTILKDTLFKNALREQMRNIEKTQIDDRHLLFVNKAIDFDSCTNCQECVVFCPTDALFATSDKQGVAFNGGACVGCGICEDVCRPDAITSSSEYDLVNFVYDRAVELVHYEMAECSECKCAYPYKGGEQICDRCKDHVDEFAELFALARDLE